MRSGDFQEIRVCNRCGKEYIATWTVQKFCEDCKAEHRKEQLREQDKKRAIRDKEASRRAYIAYKLHVIDDFNIKRPAKSELARFYDINNVTDGEIDRYFRKLIDKKLGA